jgi:hypothetical protein
MKVVLIGMGLLLISVVSGAQPSFVVAQLNGSGFYTRSAQKIPLKIGSPLTAADEMTLNGRAVATLVCDNYATFTLRAGNTSKVYSLGSCVDSCKDKRRSTSIGFIRYIWQQLTTQPAEGAEDNNEHGSVTGAVIRSPVLIPIDGYDAIPGLIRFYQRDYAVKWTVMDTSFRRDLAVFGMSDSINPVLQFPVTDQFRIKDIRRQLPAGNDTVYWTILIDGKEILDRKTLIFLTEGAYQLLQTQVPMPRKMDSIERGGPTPGELEFLTGYYLELKHVYGEAAQFYNLAVIHSPNTPFFRTSKRNLDHIFDFTTH